MRKVISPFIHLAFLIPALVIAMGAIELIARKFDLLPEYINVFKPPYIILIIGIIILSGGLLFWFANRLMRAVERFKSLTIYDHLRQSIFYYFIIVFVFFTWIFNGFNGNEDDVYFLTGLCISIVCIVVNLIFKERLSKVNIT